MEIIRDYLDHLGLRVPCETTDYTEFLELFSSDIEKWKEFSENIFVKVALQSPSFPHLLFRLMMNHYAARAHYAIALLYLFSDKDKTRTWRILGANFPLMLRAAADKELIYVFGPTLVDLGNREAERLASLQSVVVYEVQRLADATSQLRGKYSGLLCTTEEIIRNAFARPKISQSQLESECLIGSCVLKSARMNEVSKQYESVPPTFYSKLAASLYLVCTEKRNACFAFRSFSGVSDIRKRVVSVQANTLEISVSEHGPGALPVEDTARARALSGFTNWSVFIAESINMLINWLQYHASADPDGEGGVDFGRRLARYLAYPFNADECNIYRSAPKHGAISLEAYAQYSRSAIPPGRSRLIAEEVVRISKGPFPKRSIVARASFLNAEQYCVLFEQASGAAIPEDQVLCFPNGHEDSDWGRSACAIPIRFSGLSWGVIEFVSVMPHAFRETVRSKIEGVISVFAPHVLQREIFGGVRELSRTMMSTRTIGDRKGDLAAVFQNLLCARSLSIFSFKKGERPELFVQRGWSDIENILDAKVNAERTLSAIIAQFADEGVDFRWLNDALGPEPRLSALRGRNPERVLLARVLWRIAEGLGHAAIALIEFQHRPVQAENWQSLVKFVCQATGNTIGGIYSKETWDIELRLRSAHELKKSAKGLASSNEKLSKLIERLERGPDQRTLQKVRTVMTDYRRYSASVDRMTYALENTAYDPSTIEPRFGLAGSAVDRWVATGRSSIDIRDVINHAFYGASEAFTDRNILLPEFVSLPKLEAYVEEWCLQEVLLSLSQNAQKYAAPNTAILISEKSTNNLGLRISNIGPRLDEDEEHRVFNDQARGRRVVALGIEGSGYGLHYAQEMARKYMGCDLDHFQTELDKGRDAELTWHHFTLVLPRRLVKKL
ncbi:ATP-binding protein [Pseudoroseicyclus tamaricis]|uniref:Histidine kinase domain-containing protein n=1 Tax=Pseudoroseicyclus tamaricis TaxID=2705421 RepID=A0A6B2JV38_9RHOB|nr:ATP-binding protein [Pseudoroseicyclus tamaricis]NDV00489.1 hypothetical protein [Pseudoroseicyclus tamaricis]